LREAAPSGTLAVMNLYLDDDSYKRALVALLTKAAHTVVVPADVGLTGRPDPVHLCYALAHGRALLTKNYRDFPHLHDLVLGCGGHHSGILMVRQDNDPSRDMSDPDIVKAIGKLERAGYVVADQLVVLNHWR
jgi:hypothetical protein